MAATLAYAIWWISGAVFFLIERQSTYVRFHAMQAVLALGVLWALGAGLWMLGFVLVFVAPGALTLLAVLADLVWLTGIIVWLICLFKAWSGERWKLPVAGDLAERLAVAQRAKAVPPPHQ